jgi:succinylarginine dihydrolase
MSSIHHASRQTVTRASALQRVEAQAGPKAKVVFASQNPSNRNSSGFRSTVISLSNVDRHFGSR